MILISSFPRVCSLTLRLLPVSSFITGPSEREILQDLSQEEQAASASPGFLAVHSVSMLGFMTLGLEVEAQQYVHSLLILNFT